ncbi:unnamed protein product [Urochloa decumbens]|uniref:RWP-RK domain-containing protein n=1 Tax=Urochloa decumbens TaxID=240449 RepID=A0ABC8VCP9_9POAL
MSDEAYDPIADVSRYLQTPPPESHNILAAPGDEPVASHVVGAPQDVPAVQMGVAPAPLEAPPLLNPDPAFGLPPPAPTNSVENNQDGLFDDIVLPNLETMSLSDDDWFMDDGDDDEVEALIRSIEDASGNTDIGSGVAEHTAVPRVEDDYYLNFVPFVRGELDCSNCRSVREMLHESAEAVAPQFAPEAPQPATRAEENTNADDILLDAANRPWAGFNPAILESYQVAVQEAASGTDNNLLAKQRKRISDVNMEDILKCIHMSKKDAAKELNISATSLKRLCRKYNTHRWPARKIISINNKIKKLEQAAQRNVGMTGLLAFKEKLDKLKLEKKQLYASILNGTYEKEKPNGGAGPSGSGISK